MNPHCRWKTDDSVWKDVMKPATRHKGAASKTDSWLWLEPFQFHCVYLQVWTSGRFAMKALGSIKHVGWQMDSGLSIFLSCFSQKDHTVGSKTTYTHRTLDSDFNINRKQSQTKREQQVIAVVYFRTSLFFRAYITDTSCLLGRNGKFDVCASWYWFVSNINRKNKT